MNPALADIPARIRHLAEGALTQANHHAVFFDPGNEHWDFISILNTAHAGELFLKAVIAREHPLLIFKDMFTLDDNQSEQLDLDIMVRKGRTHDFEKLPQILWATTGIRLANMECFERLRKARNAIQHFCAPDTEDFRKLSLEFIYTNLDPLIASAFGLCAIEFHEDHSVGYDYVVAAILRSGLKFTLPQDFDLTEISVDEELKDATPEYQEWFRDELVKVGKAHLFKE